MMLMESHHALLCIGSPGVCAAHFPDTVRGNVDTEMIVREQFEIGDARALAEKASTRPIEKNRRHFVISCMRMTHEAQNALLKLFEDPPATARFYLVIPRADVLLATLRSRLHLLFEESASDEVSAEAESFLAGSCSERLARIADLAKAKDTQALRDLLRSLESAAAEPGRAPHMRKHLSDILMASSYAETRGASHKMLLEHLALSIPDGLDTNL